MHFKLIAAGSVEARILDMQARKRSMADALYKGARQAPSAWTEAELEALLAPLEE